MVRALEGSVKFIFIEASSAQIAHWSRGKDQYLPRYIRELICELFPVPSPTKDRTGAGRTDDSLSCDKVPVNQRRRARVLISGRRNKRNS